MRGAGVHDRGIYTRVQGIGVYKRGRRLSANHRPITIIKVCTDSRKVGCAVEGLAIGGSGCACKLEVVAYAL